MEGVGGNYEVYIWKRGPEAPLELHWVFLD